MQVFTGAEKVKMVGFIAIAAPENLSHLKTPIPIDKLVADLLGKSDAEWFTKTLVKITSLKSESYSKDNQAAMAYDEQSQKLTVTLRML